MKRLCVVCNEAPAVVPDRERIGRLIARVCRRCHQARLLNDVAYIMEVEMKRRKRKAIGQ